MPRQTWMISLLAGVLACGSGSVEPGPPDTGMAPRADAPGAVKTVEADEYRFAESVQELLQGQVAGVVVVDDPACGWTIRVRSSAPSLIGGSCSTLEPLLIIDNKPIARGGLVVALAGLTPADIDRIQVLKDVASTSVYGSRGAHGVIIVTTRR